MNIFKISWIKSTRAKFRLVGCCMGAESWADPSSQQLSFHSLEWIALLALWKKCNTVGDWEGIGQKCQRHFASLRASKHFFWRSFKYSTCIRTLLNVKNISASLPVRIKSQRSLWKGATLPRINNSSKRPLLHSCYRLPTVREERSIRRNNLKTGSSKFGYIHWLLPRKPEHPPRVSRVHCQLWIKLNWIQSSRGWGEFDNRGKSPHFPPRSDTFEGQACRLQLLLLSIDGARASVIGVANAELNKNALYGCNPLWKPYCAIYHSTGIVHGRPRGIANFSVGWLLDQETSTHVLKTDALVIRKIRIKIRLLPEFQPLSRRTRERLKFRLIRPWFGIISRVFCHSAGASGCCFV